MQCPNTPQAENKCQILLDAAEQLIEEQGIISFKFSDIAKVANTSTGSVYKFFESKEDVLLCLFLRSATSNNIPDILDTHPELTPQERFLVPIVTTYQTVMKSSSFMSLRAVSVNSKVWPLASCEKVDRFKLRCNRFFDLIHMLAVEARDSGVLEESDERLLLLAQMIYFQLYGQSTAYESKLIEKLVEAQRSQAQMEGILTIVNAFNWTQPATREQYETLDSMVSEYIARGIKSKLSCKKCLDANLQIRRLS
ncbi:TetR/AcrR family transcriptional regulator [Ferrimonas sp. YFM]|uniref:TetR/AcrR family transcriptional regulator n=1 Tax=Ferrimonas sp. YFM TaxID=3028878 RepID=UPI00257298EB|nr:TetR/AcrR family transcriptional regulator [Ferrimonas sp. YFM]BDY06079.1 TetR family transcriptional regulator [Ferrimonas sp. YFM]